MSFSTQEIVVADRSKPNHGLASLVFLGVLMGGGAVIASVMINPADDKTSKSEPIVEKIDKKTSLEPVVIAETQSVGGSNTQTDAIVQATASEEETLEKKRAFSSFTPRVKPGDNEPQSLTKLSQKKTVSPNPIKQASQVRDVIDRTTLLYAETGVARTVGAELSGAGLHSTGQTPFFFAGDIEQQSRAAQSAVYADNGDVAPAPEVLTVALKRGETFVDALRRVGVPAGDRNEAAAALSKHQNLRRLHPGHKFVLTVAAPHQSIFELVAGNASDERRLLGMEFQPTVENRITLARVPGGAFDAETSEVELTTKLASVKGRIDGSLFISATDLGAPAKVVADLANIFAYDVDFQREIFGGDEFEAIFEMRYDDRGRFAGSGDVLYARLNWRGRQREKGYYRFAKDDRPEYYDQTGQSAKRLLMKTPIDGARLSSGFGRRRHPILGYARAHKGVDFAARRGTPIYAAGDGVVERANRYGSFGNYIRIRHANGYKTAYAHLNGFRKGIRAGKRVRQGDVIGYVGTTGRSTGPHLHYEVHLNGKAVNPQRLKIATGTKLKSADLEKFKSWRGEVDAMRAEPVEEAPQTLASEESASRKAL